MRFTPKKILSRLSPKNPKKSILGTLKTSSKFLGMGLLMGAGAEVAGHISSKAQQADEGAQFITITDLGPSIARFDSVEANTDGPRSKWLFGTRNPLTFGIPTFILALGILLTCRFCWRRLRCLGGLRWCCTPPKATDLTPTPSSPPHEAVDMEEEMDRLDRDTHNPVVVQEENHYATPARQLEEVIRNVNDSTANRARIAHYNDSLHQRNDEK